MREARELASAATTGSRPASSAMRASGHDDRRNRRGPGPRRGAGARAESTAGNQQVARLLLAPAPRPSAIERREHSVLQQGWAI